ncbi:LacI family DNA-binding transcriptional regulator [Arthrobacter sp. MA-N2]|uniref:LacI family DNA-binding transcriptional regulator n=1 Tax=Arthrobacter sp. MA-N2 TaxID=1101188 RepID=UPI000482154A|nr:LacI family DNA-binding transcriptional regulator [Arthrobacter sp. MA-N2]
MTYLEIARMADVSTATVSRVLSGAGAVSDERRERVLAAAQELSYRGSRAARTLRRQKADTIGLIVSDIEYPSVASMARSVENAAAERGFALNICNSDEDLAKERKYINLLIEERVAGLIISPATESYSALEPLERAGIPVVTLDRRLQDARVDSVLLDNQKATQLLMDDLLRHGHRHFAAVVGTTVATPSRERLETMRAIVKSVPDATLIIAGSKLGETIGVSHTLETIGPAVTALALSAHPQPTAYVCVNAIMLTSVMASLIQEGLRIPQDVAVVGFDDMPGFALFQTPVTVVAQPTQELGRLAVQLLFERIASPTRPHETILVPPTFVARASCGHE